MFDYLFRKVVSDFCNEEGGAFRGAEGATSLKAEIVSRVPVCNDAATYRAARRLLAELGGAAALRTELVLSGFVEDADGQLTLGDRPYNVFAKLGSGKALQQSMQREQEALGHFRSKFVVCQNQPAADLHWDSFDPKWVVKASMAKRHRFLTTKDMHWQWFNPITFGMVSASDGGVSPMDAAHEVEAMRAAALVYARTRNWSDKIGLYFHVFGHNNVNSFFLHVIDMAELGPGFQAHSYKNCPLEDVLKVLREEAVSNLLPTATAHLSLGAHKETPLLFVGTNGSTSVKDELVARVPKLKDASGFREARRLVREDFGGVNVVKAELIRFGFVSNETKELTVGTSPFNVFARIAAGKMTQPGMDQEQEFLGDFKEKFLISCNRPENDEHWDSDDPQWIGKASMSCRHKFLITKDLHWQWFNPLVFGLVPQEEGGLRPVEVIEQVQMMKCAALEYASNAGWSSKVGLFFHVFGHCSVNSLHLHILDMEHLGPTFWSLEHKNCPLDAILKVLEEETVQVSEYVAGQSREASTAAAVAAASAAESASKALAVMVEAAGRLGRRRPSICIGEEESEVVTLNVGGDFMEVPVSTLRLVPEGSFLHKLFTSAAPERGSLDLTFLNLPSRSVRILLNHLRILDLSPWDTLVQPPLVPADQLPELEEVAWLLGLGHFLAYALPGAASRDSESFGQRPRYAVQTGVFGPCCGRRRRRPAAPAMPSSSRVDVGRPRDEDPPHV